MGAITKHSLPVLAQPLLPLQARHLGVRRTARFRLRLLQAPVVLVQQILVRTVEPPPDHLRRRGLRLALSLVGLGKPTKQRLLF